MNSIKPTLKSEWLPLLLILLAIGLGFYFQANFPDIIPSHWNINGQVDGYSTRFFGAWFMPILLIVIYLLFLALPKLDPKHEHYNNFSEAYHGIKNLFVVFMFALYVLIGLAGLGYNLPIGDIIPVGVGLLFIGMGHFLKSVQQNWWMGVRTPWTMESPTVWKKTNELMAKLMMIGGILIAMCVVSSNNIFKISLFVVAILLIAIVPVVYSYFAYRAEQKAKK